MSDTIVDMPKVTQMLDAGWRVQLYKCPLKSYAAAAKHNEEAVMVRTRARLIDEARRRLAFKVDDVSEFVDSTHFEDGWLLTDDFTPQQALTRLAYKAVDGEVI